MENIVAFELPRGAGLYFASSRANSAPPSHVFLSELNAFEPIDGQRGDAIAQENGLPRRGAQSQLTCSDASAETPCMADFDRTGVLSDLGARLPILRDWATYNFEVETYHTYIANGWRVHNDSQFYIDAAGSIGQSFGTQLGMLVAQGESQFTKLAAGTVLGVVGRNLAEVITDIGYHAFDGNQLDFDASVNGAFRELRDVGVDFATAAAGTLTSFLIAELGEELGLEGFGAELFNVTAGTYAGSVLNTVVSRAIDPAFTANLLTGADFAGALSVLPGAVGTFFGSALAREILPAETLAGSVGGSLGSIAGAALGYSLIGGSLGSSLGVLGNFLLPGIGGFFGTLIGTFLGDLFGDEPDPEGGVVVAVHQTQNIFFALPSSVRVVVDPYAVDGFPAEVSAGWAQAMQLMLDSYVEAVGGSRVTNLGSLDIDRPQEHLRMYLNADDDNYKVDEVEYSSAELMIDRGIAKYIKGLHIVGGDLLIKRAAAGSSGSDSTVISGDLAVAEQYERYLNDREVINALIASSPSSVFTAAWAITLAQAQELGLATTKTSDFNGGLEGFLGSLADAGLSVAPGDVGVTRTGSNIVVSVRVANDFVLPGVIEVFANEVTVVDNGGVRTIQFTFAGNLVAGGYTNVTGTQARTGGLTEVVGETIGRDIWIASTAANYVFTDPSSSLSPYAIPESAQTGGDILIGAGGNDRISGGVGSDWIAGGAGNDILDGSSNRDVLLGGDGNDTLRGDGGDYLEGGTGADIIISSDEPWFGGDTAGYASSNTGIFVNLTTGVATGGHAEGDQLTNIGSLVGSRFADTLIGDEYRNVLEGGAGGDTFHGGFNLDGWWADIVSHAHASTGVTASLANPSPNTGDAAGDTYINIAGLEGSAFDDFLHGDMGDNDLWGNNGDDVLAVGVGTDLAFGGNGFDLMSYRDFSMAITMNLQTWMSSSPVVADDRGFQIEGFEGTNFADNLTGRASMGEPWPDLEFVMSAHDILYGLAGNDVIFGDAGDDNLNGGADLDTLSGGTGSDVLTGGTGNDFLSGGAGDDKYVLAQDDGIDTINEISSGGIDTLVMKDADLKDVTFTWLNGGTLLLVRNGVAGEGAYIEQPTAAASRVEQLSLKDVGPMLFDVARTAAASLYGTAQGDLLIGLDGINVIAGDVGDDHLYGAGGNDTLSGGGGGDVLMGGTGNDFLSGGAGDDRYVIDFSGTDTINELAGGGSDTLVMQGVDLADVAFSWLSNGTTLQIGNGIAGQFVYIEQQTSASSRVERLSLDDVGTIFFDVARSAAASLYGTGQDDHLFGLAGDNVIAGDVGNDQLYGGGGDDTLSGDGGNDTLTGQAGNDFLSGGAGDDRYILSFDGLDEVNELSGGGVDTLVLQGVDVEDVTFAWLGDGTTLQVGSGVAGQYVNIEQQTAASSRVEQLSLRNVAPMLFDVARAAAAALAGTGGNDLLFGLEGNNTITGGAGNDILLGGAGNDTLDGGDGNDILDAQAGVAGAWQYLRGRAGDDTYQVGGDSGSVFIDATSEAAGTDKLVFTDLDLSEVSFGTYDYGSGTVNGLSLVISWTGGQVRIGQMANSIETFRFADGVTVNDIQLAAAAGGTLNGSSTADLLVGFAANDALLGLAGNDVLLGEAGNDTLDGGDGNDILDAQAGVAGGWQYLRGRAGDDTYQVGGDSGSVFIDATSEAAGTDKLVFTDLDLSEVSFGTYDYGSGTVNGLSLVISWTGGQVRIGQMANTIEAFQFADGIIVNNIELAAAAGGTLNGSSTADLLVGSDADDVLLGLAGKDVLLGGAGNDTLDGSNGADRLEGGAGNDFYKVDDTGDVIIEATGGGSDTAMSSVDYVLAAGVEVELLRTDADAGTAAIDLTGNSLAQTLRGNAGANVLNGGGGVDTLQGLGGNDTYRVNNSGVIIVEAAGGGNDTVLSYIDYVLAAGVEIELLRTNGVTGTSAIDLIGNELAQTIQGNAGVNILNDGGGGADTMQGLGGDDTYVVANSGAVIVEAAGGGDDAVKAAVDYVLQATVEVEQLRTDLDSGTAAIDLTGNELVQLIVGNAGANILSDGGGADTMEGLGGNDTYRISDSGAIVVEASGGGTDTVMASVDYVLKAGAAVERLRTTSTAGTASIDLTGNELAQTITGNAGANTLDDGGGSSVDTLEGLGGNDNYRVRNSGAIVIEAAGGGTDTVFAAVDYVLKAGVEIETLRAISSTSTASIDLTGNELAQTLQGNAGANILNDGGGAADTLQGREGNDIYVVGNGGAVIIEAAGGGNDIVKVSVQYVLAAGVEVEQLLTDLDSGTAAINLTGNELVQLIVGNAGANILSDGGGAADTLRGLAGNDTYLIANSAAVVEEAVDGGTGDRVQASVSYVLGAGVEVEVLATNSTAGTTAINLTGNELAQTVNGNAGDNILDGKGGNDRLIGLGGKDFFVFSTALGTGNVDTIADFNITDDTIRLENAIFTKLTATGALNAGLFLAGTDATALDANDYILYDTVDGKLYYDADGNGAGARIHFATLTGAPVIVASDFAVV